MKRAVIKEALPLFTREVEVAQISMGREDYLFRIGLLRERMRRDGVDVALFFGDREHYGHMEYFSGYDCRFEEGILAIPVEGTPTIVCGNEGMSYSQIIPYAVNRVYYRNLSLQCQPRRAEEKLDEIFRAMGIGESSRVGVIGYKYFQPEYISTDPRYTFDIPHYLLEILRTVARPENVINYAGVLTGLEDGIRLKVYCAKEIAAAEAAACRSANGVLRMLKALRPGIAEYEVGASARIGLAPVTMFPLTNFGPRHVALGIASPSDDTRLELGDVCGVCYGIRGSLTSRVGVAAYNEATMRADLLPHLYSFYGKFYEALGAWYERVQIGVTGDALHHAVHDIIGGPEYNVELNCGHYTGQDEWTNSLSFDGSAYTLPDGAYMQVDVIASNPDPVRTAICEDTAVIAGPELRDALRKEYPETWARIQERRDAMIRHLGIALHDEVLPLSNLNAAMFPFMLNLNRVFALKEE